MLTEAGEGGWQDVPKARRLLHAVILMAVRDAARVIRFEPDSTQLQMWYFAEPNIEGEPRRKEQWFLLAPVPVSCWSEIVEIVRSAGDDVRALCGWWTQPDGSVGPAVEAGRLTHRLGAYQSDWAVLLDTRPGSPHMVLSAVGAKVSPEYLFGLGDTVLGPGGAIEWA